VAEGSYLLDIDFGTGGARVGIFDPEGTPIVFSEREFTLEHPRPGWAEQDPNEWWSSLVGAVNDAMEESGVPAGEIVGISVGSGLRFSEARGRMPGVKLEGAAAIEVIGGALLRLAERGIIGPGDFPLMRHLHSVVVSDEPLDMPWSTFFGGEPGRKG
jgi:FGGY family of carbohydrate kinases, N-terminal domain